MATNTAILIVADEEPILKLLQVNLSKAGYQVIAVSDASAAIKPLKERRPSLAIFDTTESISESVKALDTMRPYCGFPVITLITRNGVAALQNVLAPEDEFLVKPFEINKLLSLVQSKLPKV